MEQDYVSKTIHTTFRSMYETVRMYLKLLFRRGIHQSYAQNGEDVILRAIVPQRDGVYIDIGSYHPVLYSNTYGMYRRGWRGIVIDPNQDLRPLYQILRPRDTFVASGIDRIEGTRTYHRFSDGAYNTFDPESAKEYTQHSWLRVLPTREVTLRPLADIVHMHGITHIDVLNIDVEGLDLAVLESHDWNIPPMFIAVEDRNFDAHHPLKSRTVAFLVEKKYHLSGLTRDTLIFKRMTI